MLAGLLAAAPAWAGLRELRPGEVPTLAAHEGLVLVGVDSSMPLAVARFARTDDESAFQAMAGLPAGRSYGLYVATHGPYRWIRADTTSTVLPLAHDAELNFQVDAGRLNYVGDLVLRPVREEAGVIVEASATLANRSLAAMDWLERQHPQLSAVHPLRYAGRYADPFPAFYERERSAHGVLGTQDASFHAPPPPVAPVPVPMSRLWREPRYSQAQLNPRGDLLALLVREDERHWRVDVVDLVRGGTTPVASGAETFGQILWAGDRRLVLGSGSQPYRRSVQVVRLERRAGRWAPRSAPLPRPGEVLHARLDVLVFASVSGAGELQVHRLDASRAASFEAQLAPRNRLEPGIAGALHWETDGDGALRLARVRQGADEVWLHGRDGRFREVRRLRDALDFEPVGLSRDGALLYALTERGRGQRDAVAIDLATNRIERTVFSRPGVDVETLVLDAAHEPVGVTFVRDGQRLGESFGARGAQANRRFARLFPGRAVSAAARDAAGGRWVVWSQASDHPPSLHVVDLDSGRVRPVPGNTPWLDGMPLAATQLLHVPTRDGLTLEAFLTLPGGQGAVPLVVMPHGGPIGVADTRQFDARVQFLAALGYAVLRVNFRGSSGYGRAFREAGHQAQGTAIEDDVDAAIAHVTGDDPTARRVDARRMCIVGSSYGGYSGLVAAVRWPQRFRCVVSIGGVSDRLLSFTASDSTTTARGRAQLAEVVGDPDAQYERILATSPLYRYRELSTPVMLAHGIDDRRVDFEQARRLERMLALAGRRPVGLAFEDEGHGLVRATNIDRLWNGVAGFLQQALDAPARRGGTGRGGTGMANGASAAKP